MSDVFRSGVRSDLTRLLAHWKQVEFWIKRAEQVSGEAVIPAINELRYASRQIFQVVMLLENEYLNDGERDVINKRLVIGEQYLLNADHDVCDSIISFFAENIVHLDNTYGISEVTMYFHDYPLLRKKIKDCYALVAGSRREYGDRKLNYSNIRDEQLKYIIDSYESLVDAEVSAKMARERLKGALTIANGTNKVMFLLTIVGCVCGVISVISVPLSVYLWLNGPQSFCKRNSSRAIFSYICSYAAIDDVSSANILSTSATPDAPAPRSPP